MNCGGIEVVLVEKTEKELTPEIYYVDIQALQFFKNKGYNGKNDIRELWDWLLITYGLTTQIGFHSKRYMTAGFISTDIGELNIIRITEDYFDITSYLMLLNKCAKFSLNFFDDETGEFDVNLGYTRDENNLHPIKPIITT